MGSEWAVEKLSELTSKITKGTTPSKKDGGFVPSGINFIKAECVTLQGTIDDSKFAYVTDEVHKKYKRSHLEAGDILFSMAGVILGKTALVKNEHLPANTNQALSLIRPITEKILPRYLHYFLQQGSVFHFVNNSTSQSAQPNINLQEIGSLDVTVPPLPEQKAIAHILGVLDDKIELNRRMNETLEGMAQALFKSWFVDFDPVIDNILARNLARCPSPNLSRGERDAAGNKGGSSPSGRSGDEGSIFDGIPEEFAARAKTRRKALAAGTANREAAKAFPDSFQETEEMGWIPEGWEERPFGSLLEKTIGGDWGKEQEDEKHSHPVVIIRGTDIPHLKNGDRSSAPERWVEPKKFATRQLKDGDIVIEISGGSPTQPTGRSLLITDNILKRLGENSVPASFCRRFRPLSSAHGLYGALYLTKIYSEGKMWEHQNQSTGISNFQTASFLEREYLAFPDNEELFDKFVALIRPLIDKSTENQQGHLIRLRDTLLPKLISGELRIEDAEKMVKDGGADFIGVENI